MRTFLLSFGTRRYARPLRRLAQSATKHFDRVLCLRENTELLSKEWRADNREILRYARGWGFWCWKPELIYSALMLINKGDVLMYCDSQVVFKKSPQRLFDLCLENNGVLLFNQKYAGHTNKPWTKRECLIRMDCDTEEFWKASQLNAAMSVWSWTKEASDLLFEWSGLCCDYDIVSDKNNCAQHPEFKDHRHDQSVLSLLAKQRSLPTYTDPSQFGNPHLQQEYYDGKVLSIDRMVSRDYPIPCLHPTLP